MTKTPRNPVMAEETKDMQMRNNPEPKVGVYVCGCGGNISDEVDVEKVCDQVGKIPGVVVARSNMFMCSDPGQEMIVEDLKNGTVDRVVVASCAPNLHEATFRNAIARAGGNPYVYEHANIREQVSWVHHGAAATGKAVRMVAAATAKAKLLEPLDPIRVEARRHATVIGAGIAGLKAAKDLAARGIKVALVERSPFVGGRAAHLDRVAPDGARAGELISRIAAAVVHNPAITIYNCARVVAFDGYVGNFRITIRREPPHSESLAELGCVSRESCASVISHGSGGPGVDRGTFIPFAGILPRSIPRGSEEYTLETGAMVLATGSRPYQPRMGEYGFGEFGEVITLPEIIKAFSRERPEKGRLVVNGRAIRSLAMIHCVGSRQIPGIHEEDADGNLNEHCSRTCCGAALHLANRIREACPRTRVYDFYRDIRTYGRGQEELYENASKNRVLFFRFEAGDPPEVVKGEGSDDYPLRVKVKDTLTFGEDVEVPVDLVVLLVGIEPNDVSDLVDMMKLPVGADRFLLEVHPKLRPVELSVAGVLLAGTCQAPMDMGEASSAASAAAVKASGLLGRGYVELDPFVAEVDIEKCTGTGACVDACLRDGALNLVEIEKHGEKMMLAQVNPALCMGCGACVAVCPQNAINVKGWTLDQYEAMVDMIVSDEGIEELRN